MIIRCCHLGRPEQGVCLEEGVEERRREIQLLNLFDSSFVTVLSELRKLISCGRAQLEASLMPWVGLQHWSDNV